MCWKFDHYNQCSFSSSFQIRGSSEYLKRRAKARPEYGTAALRPRFLERMNANQQLTPLAGPRRDIVY